MSGSSLSGRKILITRAADDARDWALRIAALGAEPVVLPCIRHEPVRDPDLGPRLRTWFAVSDWLLLFSARAAHAVACLTDATLPAHLRIAAVGRSTARAAEQHLRAASFVAATATGSGLAHELLPLLRASGPTRPPAVTIAAAVGGRSVADDVLTEAGVLVRRAAVYRARPVRENGPTRDLAAEGVDVVLLASPSAVAGLLYRVRLPITARVITIGPTTTAAAREAGLDVAAESQRPDLESMLEALG